MESTVIQRVAISCIYCIDVHNPLGVPSPKLDQFQSLERKHPHISQLSWSIIHIAPLFDLFILDSTYFNMFPTMKLVDLDSPQCFSTQSFFGQDMTPSYSIPASTSGQGLPPPCHVHLETCGILKGAVHEVGAEAVPQTQSV